VGSSPSASQVRPSPPSFKESSALWTPADAADFPPTLSVEHAAELLGVSRSAAYRAVAAGQLPSLRLGRRIYVPTAPLLAMLGLLAEERR
jgi:excisionase family DNA binding protein